MSVKDKELRKKQAFLREYPYAESDYQKEIERRINGIPEYFARKVLWHRYILEQSWVKVCMELNYGRTAVTNHHLIGLKLLKVPEEVMA